MDREQKVVPRVRSERQPALFTKEKRKYGMKQKYRVLAARIVYDEHEVEAETPKEAAYLVANGKVYPSREAVEADHDNSYDDGETVVVLSDEIDSHGFKKKLLDTNTREALGR